MNSLGRALQVLEILGRQPCGLTNAQISRHLGIATSSCSYLLNQLEQEGCVSREPETGRYEVGMRLVALANGAMRASGFRRLSGPVMYQLANDTHLTVAISTLGRDGVLFLERVDYPDTSEFHSSSSAAGQSRTSRAPSGKSWVGYQITIGSIMPFLTTASGRVLLASLSRSQALEMLNRESGNGSEPPNLGPELWHELAAIRQQGYAVLSRPNFRSIAAPIAGPAGVTCAVLAITGPLSQPAWAEMDHLISLVKAAAKEISRRIANRPRAKYP